MYGGDDIPIPVIWKSALATFVLLFVIYYLLNVIHIIALGALGMMIFYWVSTSMNSGRPLQEPRLQK